MNPFDSLTPQAIAQAQSTLLKLASSYPASHVTARAHLALSRALEIIQGIQAPDNQKEGVNLAVPFKKLSTELAEVEALFSSIHPRAALVLGYVRYTHAGLGKTWGLEPGKPAHYWEMRQMQLVYAVKATTAQKPATAHLLSTMSGVYLHLAAAILAARLKDANKANWNLSKAEQAASPVASKLFDADRELLIAHHAEAAFEVGSSFPPAGA